MFRAKKQGKKAAKFLLLILGILILCSHTLYGNDIIRYNEIQHFVRLTGIVSTEKNTPISLTKTKSSTELEQVIAISDRFFKS